MTTAPPRPAAPARPGAGPRAKRPPLLLEVALIVWLCWVYDAVNNLAPLRRSAAFADGSAILGFERHLHLDPEASLDHWLASHHAFAVVVANFYDNAHFVVTLGLIALVWWFRPAAYRPLRNGLVIANLMAMAVFWLFPTAPPRLLHPAVYPDVVAATHAFGSWHAGTLATAANELAAMPSLHITWACWSALAFRRLLPGRRWTVVAWLHPLITAYAVMATGNHYLLDLVAGAAVFGLGQLIAERAQP